MVNLQKLLGKMLQVETQTFTALGKSWYFRRIGPVTYLDAPNDSTNVAAGFNSIGTLRASMRPKYTQRIPVGNGSGNGFLDINPDGTVRLYAWSASAAARNCSISTSFLSGGYNYCWNSNAFSHKKVVGAW